MRSIVLSRRDFREFDQIISVYTQEHGKHELLGTGIKKITSKNSAHLEPFSIVDLDIAQGKEIDHLTKVQPVEYFSGIRENLDKSMAAQYVVSLTDKLVQVGETDLRLFNALVQWLEFLNSHKLTAISLKILLDGYLVILLFCLGFAVSKTDLFARWSKTIEMMENGDWESVSQSEYDDTLHRKLFEFLQYQTERKVADWAKTCMI